MRKLLIVMGGLLAVLVGLALAVVLLVDPNDYRDEIAARASSTLGREVELAGPISLRVFPWFALEIDDVAVGNPPGFETAPALARVGQAAAAVRLWPLLRGELEIGTITLSDAHFAIVTDRRGQSNLDGLLTDRQAGADPEGSPDLSRLSLGRLQFREVSLELLDLASSERTLARLHTLDLDPFQAGQLVPLSLRGSVSDGDTMLIDALELQAGLRVAADLGRVWLDNVQARLALPAADVQVEGELNLQLDTPTPLLTLARLNARVDAAGQDIRFELDQPLRIVLDDGPAGELSAARLDLNGQVLALAGSFVLGDPFTAELAVNGERLDLRPLLAGGEQTAEPTAAGAPPAHDFAPLIGPTLGFDLALNELIVSDELRLSGVSARARLRAGQLHLDPLQAGLFGGDFAGSVSIDFTLSPPRTRVSPRFTGIRAEQVASLVSDTAPLRGLGDMRMDFQFSGLSASEILASLDGEGSFRLDDGALLGVDLRRLIDEQFTVSTLADINQSFGGETPFRSLTGSMRAESGVIALPDLSLDAADFGASGRGQLDFAAGEVAYRLDLRLGEALVERLPRQLARATGGLVPLTVAGPLARPVVRVDLASMAEEAIQRQLEDRLLERLRQPDPVPQEPEQGEETESEAEPQRRVRSSDLLLRTLRERQEREREPPP